MKIEKPETEVKRRIAKIFDMKNVSEVARRSGYAEGTLRSWKRNPRSIKAVDLIRLEQVTGTVL